MASEELIISTIKRMLQSGIDDKIVVSTLKDIGLKESEIADYLAKVKGTSSSRTQKPFAKEKSPEQETQELLHSATHNKLNEHSESLDSVNKGVSSLSKKIDSIVSGPDNQQLFEQVSLLDERIANLEKQLSDLKALNSANKSLLEKILEANKGILEKL